MASVVRAVQAAPVTEIIDGSLYGASAITEIVPILTAEIDGEGAPVLPAPEASPDPSVEAVNNQHPHSRPTLTIQNGNV